MRHYVDRPSFTLCGQWQAVRYTLHATEAYSGNQHQGDGLVASFYVSQGAPAKWASRAQGRSQATLDSTLLKKVNQAMMHCAMENRANTRPQAVILVKRKAGAAGGRQDSAPRLAGEGVNMTVSCRSLPGVWRVYILCAEHSQERQCGHELLRAEHSQERQCGHELLRPATGSKLHHRSFSSPVRGLAFAAREGSWQHLQLLLRRSNCMSGLGLRCATLPPFPPTIGRWQAAMRLQQQATHMRACRRRPADAAEAADSVQPRRPACVPQARAPRDAALPAVQGLAGAAVVYGASCRARRSTLFLLG
eukprot:361689-Chlamydomonas_euryale.AAC.15